ncbi:unnamed protein product [Anisakis simplex]|uniref:FERM domain-containing protein n=1 Tax=Anisakis simplex TaxID=6269 RepID=A0A3P6RQS3_ANISI|nr:unnamed protein product [Anisakis simplex]
MDKDKPILRQITATQSDARFYFIVKFYTPNPADLEEEYTRYLMALQIKRDLASGELLCNENTAALLASYIVQADCGDFSAEDYPDSSYLSSGRFLPNQSLDFQNRVMENHMKLMYHGRTQKQLIDYVREHHKRREPFTRPIRPGLSSRCDRLSRPAQFNLTPNYSTVSDRAINIVSGMPCSSSSQQPRRQNGSASSRFTSGSMPHINGASQRVSDEAGSSSMAGDGVAIGRSSRSGSSGPGSVSRAVNIPTSAVQSSSTYYQYGDPYSYSSVPRPQRHHHHMHHAQSAHHPSGAMSDGERMCSSDVDTSISSGIHPSSSASRHTSNNLQHAYITKPLQAKQYKALADSHISSISNLAVSDSEAIVTSSASSQYRNRHNHAYATSTTAASSSVAASTYTASGVGAQNVVGGGNAANGSNNVESLMSLSLPNVLGADVQLVCKEFELKCECPPKSASGDNFLEMQQRPREYDNISEESYRLSDHEQRHPTASSSQPSEVIGQTPSVYATTFTTKRVGNVIVKRIVSSAHGSRSTPNTTDDEDLSASKDHSSKSLAQDPYRQQQQRYHMKRDLSEGPMPTYSSSAQDARYVDQNYYQNIGVYPSSYPSETSSDVNVRRRIQATEKRIQQSSSSAPSSSVEYPIHKKLVPVEIDGPNVNLESYYRRREEENAKERRTPSLLESQGTQPGKTTETSTFRSPAQPMESLAATSSVASARSESKEVPMAAVSAQVRQAPVIYTSKGAVLQKPKVIPDSDTYRMDERHIYGQLKYPSQQQQPQTSADQSSAYGETGFVHGQSQASVPTAPKTYGAIGPLPGKVITKENLVVTPEGLREKKPKPVVPPKPKNLMSPMGTSLSESSITPSTSGTLAPLKQSAHPVVNLQQGEMESAQKTSSLKAEESKPLQRPMLISVQSEDRPDIQKCHLFNGDIPYVLTVRDISRDRAGTPESSFSTFKGPSASRTLPDAGVAAGTSSESETLLRNRTKSRSPESLKRRKSLDLVPRKRLPSPGNFSSQDHSISPTTPESGDILEYLLRRRSASTERSALVKRGRRGDPRRQTQPVRFNLPPSPEIEHPKVVTFSSEPNLQNDQVEEPDPTICDSLSLQDEAAAVSESNEHLSLNRSMSNIETSTAFGADDEMTRTDQRQKGSSEPPMLVAASVPIVPPEPISKREDANSVDDYLPPPPPPPPPLVPMLFGDPILSEPMPAPPANASPATATTTVTTTTSVTAIIPSESITDPLLFADDTNSSRTSYASREDSLDQNNKDKSEIQPSSQQQLPKESEQSQLQQTSTSSGSSTLRTPTGVLWTDF